MATKSDIEKLGADIVRAYRWGSKGECAAACDAFEKATKAVKAPGPELQAEEAEGED